MSDRPPAEPAPAGADRVPSVITGVTNPEAIQLLIDKERHRERQRASGGPSAV